MADQKQTTYHPLHELIMSKIMMALTTGLPPNAQYVIDQLDTLHYGKMKAEDAHEVAKKLADFPRRLKNAGSQSLSMYFEEVLTDLRGRTDESKVGEETLTARQQLAGIGRDSDEKKDKRPVTPPGLF